MAFIPASNSVVAFQSQPSSLLVGASVIGVVPVSLSGINVVSVVGNMNSSVTAFQGGAWRVSVLGAGASGEVIMTGSIQGTVSVIGTVPVTQATTPWLIGNSSVQTIQGTTPWVVGSVIATIQSSVAVAVTNISASVLVSQNTNPWVIGSIVGTFSEDAGHTNGDRGLFVLGVRNDAVSSITTAETDYSPHVVDAVGRTIVKPFAGEQACIISYIGSVTSGSVTLIQPSVIGSRSYITDFWIANTGSVTQLVTFQGGDTSILLNTIAPAGGGSNSQGINIPIRTTLSQDLAFKGLGTTSMLYVTVKGYQAP